MVTVIIIVIIIAEPSDFLSLAQHRNISFSLQQGITVVFFPSCLKENFEPLYATLQI